MIIDRTTYQVLAKNRYGTQADKTMAALMTMQIVFTAPGWTNQEPPH